MQQEGTAYVLEVQSVATCRRLCAFLEKITLYMKYAYNRTELLKRNRHEFLVFTFHLVC